ncbi:hypothetical protein Trihar35433_1740 [Trichoderma harzianum]|nr:hypothetical protein Trihar35433_1740 [Trichoderma harzianum]
MLRFLVPPSDSVYPSRDSRFRRSFYQQLHKNPPRLTKEGYIRALELYGREDKLLDSLQSSVSRFNQWKRDNPGDLAEYRRYANKRDYDWENGSVDKNSFYTSYIQDESPEVSQENLTAPVTMPQSQDQEEEVAPLPVQRRLLEEASTPSRKRPSSLFQELQAEDDSEHEDAGRVRGQAREQFEMPYILEDCWEVAGESIPVSVLYANGQALPLRDTNVAKLLGRFHEAVIKEGQMNVTLAKSMNMLGIPAAAILRPGPAVAYLTGEGAIKALDASSTCSKLAQRSAARKLVLAAVEFYDKHGYTQISKSMPALFQLSGLPTYAESKTSATKLTINGQANFNAPNEKGDIPVHQVGPPGEGENNGESSSDDASDG